MSLTEKWGFFFLALPPPLTTLLPPLSPSPAANHNSSDTIKLIKIINESRMFQTYLKDVLFWEVSAENCKILMLRVVHYKIFGEQF